MKIRRTVYLKRGPIDVAPLVDVVLLLLVFFILSSSFVLQPGIHVNPPRSTNDSGVRDSRYIITVTADIPPLIFFNDKQMDFAELRTRLNELAETKGDVSLVLRADESVKHGTVVRIINYAYQVRLPILIATQVDQ